MPRTLILLGILALGTAGCPGRLDEAQIEAFGDGSYCPPGMTVEGVFEMHCGGSVCHGGGSRSPAADLDLTSPGIAQRLVEAPSGECNGEVLVVPGNPDESFLYMKVTSPPLGCGDLMPVLGRLSFSEVSCIRFWIQDMDASDPPELDGGAS